MANCLCAHERAIMVLISRIANIKITLEWAHKQFVTRVHTLFNFLRGIRIHKWRWKRRSSHIDFVSRSPCLRSADDVTIHCWWRHNYPTIMTRLTRAHESARQLVRYRLYSQLYSGPVAQKIVYTFMSLHYSASFWGNFSCLYYEML